MKFVLTPMGSGGDVYPFLGLALRLRERGHQVAMITNGHFRPAIEKHGIEMDDFGTNADYMRAIENPQVFHPTKGFRTVMGFVSRQRELRDLIRKHTSQGAIVLAHSIAFAARLMEEAGEARVISILLQPAVLRSVFDGPVLNGNSGITRLPQQIQRCIWWLVDRVLVDPPVAAILDDLRRDMGLRRQRRFFGNWLHSPSLTIGLFPDWYAPPQPDWPASVKLTSFPLCDAVAGHPTPPPLLHLLDRGERPIVFTPGTGNRHAHEFFDAAVQACRVLGRTGLLLTTHREHLPDALPPGIHHFDFAPLSEILPRCSALVHHGGVGTAAAALAAGIPQIIMPLSHDQPDNAARVVRNHWGERLWPRRFTGQRLAGSLDDLLSSKAVAASCQAAAARLADEDALRRTSELIESHI